MEPTIEDQAAMAIVLSDKIRELVRTHLFEALTDPSFMDSINPYQLTTAVTRFISTDYNFQNAVKQVMISQMHK